MARLRSFRPRKSYDPTSGMSREERHRLERLKQPPQWDVNKLCPCGKPLGEEFLPCLYEGKEWHYPCLHVYLDSKS